MRSKWKLGAEHKFERLGESIVAHPVRYLLLSLFLVCASLSFTVNLQFDTTLEGFLERESKPLERYELFREDFGQDMAIVVAVTSDQIMSPDTLQRIHDLSEDLEQNLKGIDQVDSLLSSYTMISEGDDITAEPFITEAEINSTDIALKKKWLEDNETYLSRFLSQNENMMLLFLELDLVFSLAEETDLLYSQSIADQEAIRALSHRIEERLEAHSVEGFQLEIAGAPVVLAHLEDYVIEDIKTFLVLVMLVLTAILFFSFRRTSAVVLPLIVVNAAMLTTVGLLPAFGQPIQIPTAILPTFILAIGVGDSIHFLVYFYKHFQQQEEKASSVVNALKHTGLPMLLTTVTTAAGLFTFAASDVVPIANVGVFSAVGVIMAFLFTILLLPALVLLSPVKPGLNRNVGFASGVLEQCKKLSLFMAIKHPRMAVILSLVVVLGSIYSMTKIEFSVNPLKWMPEEAQLRKTTERIDGLFDGTIPIEISIDTGKSRGILESQFLNAVEAANDSFKTFETEHVHVGHIASVNDLVREMNRVLNEGKLEAYNVPQDQSETAQNLFMLELVAGDLLYQYVDQDLQKMRISVLVPWVDMRYMVDISSKIESHYKSYLPAGVSVETTGIVDLISVTYIGLMDTTIVSYTLAFVIISILMIIVVGEFKLGIVSMLPNLAPIIFVLGCMSLIGTPLEVMTVLIGSVAIGLAVDDTIHFINSYQRSLAQTKNFEIALRETLDTTGSALLVTTLSLSGGFIVLAASNMMMVSNFGMAVSVALAFALAFDFFLLPALIAVFAAPKMPPIIEKADSSLQEHEGAEKELFGHAGRMVKRNSAGERASENRAVEESTP